VHDRLQSFAQVHHSLQMPDYSTTIEVTAYLHRLRQAISHSKLESQGIELPLSLYPFRMSSERCWYLGMIVFELITNALRHAFRQGPGQIRLELWPSDMSVQCRITRQRKLRRRCSPRHRPDDRRGVGRPAARDNRRGTQSALIFPLQQ
jgi:two-component sensor histidine kinase